MRFDLAEDAVEFGLLHRAPEEEVTAFFDAVRELGVVAVADQHEGADRGAGALLKFAPFGGS